MKGCSTAFFMWLPILIFKLFKGIWILISWILQTISGVPLYFCKPEYRIPAQILGTIGLIFMFFFLFGIFIALLNPGHLQQQGTSLIDSIFSIFILGGIGFLLLFICRILIKRGSI